MGSYPLPNIQNSLDIPDTSERKGTHGNIPANSPPISTNKEDTVVDEPPQSPNYSIAMSPALSAPSNASAALNPS